MTNHLPNRPRAYSYVRFSTPEQMRGDSFRRQTEAAERYAAAHGLDLVVGFDQVADFEEVVAGVAGSAWAGHGGGIGRGVGHVQEFITARS